MRIVERPKNRERETEEKKEEEEKDERVLANQSWPVLERRKEGNSIVLFSTGKWREKQTNSI